MFTRKLTGFLAILALLTVLGLGVTVVLAQDAAAPTVLQDFEGDVALEDTYQATASISDVAQTGSGALASTSDAGEWHTVAAGLIGAPVDISADEQICFAVQDTTAANNTVGVKLVDATGANTERWTDNEGVGDNPKTVQNEWVTMCLNLVTYTGIDLTQISSIQFTMYAAGVYYFDDVVAGVGLAAPAAAASGPTTVLLSTTVADFEGSADSVYSDYQADVSLSTEVFHSGAQSFEATSAEGEWHAFGAFPTPRPIDLSGYGVLCFWIMDTTANNDGAADNTVGVSLIDVNGTKDEVWTDNEAAGGNPKTVKDEWVQMCMDLSAYQAADLTQIDKIQFALYWAGTYYVDDIQLGVRIPDPAAQFTLTPLQDFEGSADSVYSDYQADVSLSTDVFHSGAQSLLASSAEGEWHAFGAMPTDHPVDLSGYDAICFWIMDTTANNDGAAANTVGVSLIDATGTKDEVWTDHDLAGTNTKTIKDTWVQMCINLAAYQTADLTQIDKIQFALYWAGDYYIDDISAGTLIAAE